MLVFVLCDCFMEGIVSKNGFFKAAKLKHNLPHIE